MSGKNDIRLERLSQMKSMTQEINNIREEILSQVRSMVEDDATIALSEAVAQMRSIMQDIEENHSFLASLLHVLGAEVYPPKEGEGLRGG